LYYPVARGEKRFYYYSRKHQGIIYYYEDPLSSMTPAMASQLYSKLSAFVLKVTALRQAEQESGARKSPESSTKEKEEGAAIQPDSLLTRMYSDTSPAVGKGSSTNAIEESILQALLHGNSNEYGGGFGDTFDSSASLAAVKPPAAVVLQLAKEEAPPPVAAAPTLPSERAVEKEVVKAKAADTAAQAEVPAKKKLDLEALLGGRASGNTSAAGGGKASSSTSASSGGGGTAKKQAMPAYLQAMLGGGGGGK
jgi:hypothetical protein